MKDATISKAKLFLNGQIIEIVIDDSLPDDTGEYHYDGGRSRDNTSHLFDSLKINFDTVKSGRNAEEWRWLVLNTDMYHIMRATVLALADERIYMYMHAD